MTPDTARRHHIVSRFYLEGFAATKRKGRLLVLDAATRQHFRTHPKNVAVERDFNRLDIAGCEPDALEKDLADFESLAAASIGRLVAAKNFASAADRSTITTFIALMLIRNPFLRSSMAEFQEQIMKKTLQVVTSSEKIWQSQQQRMIAEGYIPAVRQTSYRSMRDFVSKDAYTVRMQREFFISHEMRLMQTLPQYVARRNWVVLKATTDSGGFLTSDHPVSLMWSDPKMNSGPYGPGLGLRGTTLTFPVSPEIGLLGAFEAKADVLEVGPEVVAMFNGGTIASASRQVYARDEKAAYMLGADNDPRPCMALLFDRRFKAAKKPKRPWY